MLSRLLWKDESKYINLWRVNVLQLEPITNTPLGIFNLIEHNPTIPVLLASSQIVFPKQQIPDDYDTTKILTLDFVFAKAQPLPENVEEFLNNNIDTPVVYGVW